MPRLRILAGPSLSNLKEIQANTAKGVDVSSAAFEGQVAVYIKGFADPSGGVQNSAYFETEQRKDVTWSIQFQGRFLKPHSADDILFGNVFDRPLPIPWGFSTILGFMKYVDPTLEQDLQSQTKPWALSPLISTMTHLTHTTGSNEQKTTNFPSSSPTGDDTSKLPFQSGSRPPELSIDSPGTAEERRAFFKTADHRKLVTLGPEDLITADFCYNYLLFSPTGVQLKIPGGFTLDMMKFWDGRPVNFVCGARRSDNTSEGPPLGEVFFCLAIEVLQDMDEEDSEEEGEYEDAVEDADVD